MNLRSIGTLVFIWLYLLHEVISVNKNINVSRGLKIYRTTSVTGQSCNCSMSFSCSCCQRVMILYTKKQKDLCVNFTYQRNGLNVDVALSSDIISTRTVTNFRAFQFCVYVPGCLFSTACANILELNQFISSITACLRFDIYAKKQLWQINYACISVSTELPMISTNDTMRMTDTAIEETSVGSRSSTAESVTEMASSETAIMQTSEMNDVKMSGGPEDVEDITEMLEIIFEETTPIK